jgi:uncharacterized protein with HEPN domain
MLLAARDARGFVFGLDETAFIASRLHQHAVIRSFEIISEAVSKISEATQAMLRNVPWREIAGMGRQLIRSCADLALVTSASRGRLL